MPIEPLVRMEKSFAQRATDLSLIALVMDQMPCFCSRILFDRLFFLPFGFHFVVVVVVVVVGWIDFLQ